MIGELKFAIWRDEYQDRGALLYCGSQGHMGVGSSAEWEGPGEETEHQGRLPGGGSIGIQL